MLKYETHRRLAGLFPDASALDLNIFTYKEGEAQELYERLSAEGGIMERSVNRVQFTMEGGKYDTPDFRKVVINMFDMRDRFSWLKVSAEEATPLDPPEAVDLPVNEPVHPAAARTVAALEQDSLSLMKITCGCYGRMQ